MVVPWKNCLFFLTWLCSSGFPEKRWASMLLPFLTGRDRWVIPSLCYRDTGCSRNGGPVCSNKIWPTSANSFGFGRFWFCNSCSLGKRADMAFLCSSCAAYVGGFLRFLVDGWRLSLGHGSGPFSRLDISSSPSTLFFVLALVPGSVSAPFPAFSIEFSGAIGSSFFWGVSIYSVLPNSLLQNKRPLEDWTQVDHTDQNLWQRCFRPKHF